MTRQGVAHVLKMVLAVAVITGWFLALLWFVLAVSQIAVEHTVVRPCAAVVAVAAPGELAC